MYGWKQVGNEVGNEVVKWTRGLASRRVSRPIDGHASGDHGDHFLDIR